MGMGMGFYARICGVDGNIDDSIEQKTRISQFENATMKNEE